MTKEQEKQAIDIVVINLARSIERRQTIETRLGSLGLPFRVFDAVDGREGEHPLFARYDERQAEIRRGFPLTRGELGCYASHYLVWQQCIDNDRPVLILEDDIDISDDFVAASRLTEQKLHTYGLIRLSAHKDRDYAVVEPCPDGYQIIRFKIGPHGGSAYALTPQAARRLLDTATTWFEPVDCHLDRFWTHGVGSYGLTPFPVTHVQWSPQQSEIWQGNTREKKSRRYRKLRALYRAKDDIGRFLYNLAYWGRWQAAVRHGHNPTFVNEKAKS